MLYPERIVEFVPSKLLVPSVVSVLILVFAASVPLIPPVVFVGAVPLVVLF